MGGNGDRLSRSSVEGSEIEDHASIHTMISFDPSINNPSPFLLLTLSRNLSPPPKTKQSDPLNAAALCYATQCNLV